MLVPSFDELRREESSLLVDRCFGAGDAPEPAVDAWDVTVLLRERSWKTDVRFELGGFTGAAAAAAASAAAASAAMAASFSFFFICCWMASWRCDSAA